MATPIKAAYAPRPSGLRAAPLSIAGVLRPHAQFALTYACAAGENHLQDSLEEPGFLGAVINNTAFLLTVFYVFLTIISPEQFGELGTKYDVLTYVGAAVLVLSLPAVFTLTRLRSSPQILLLVGFVLAVGVSEVANGWLGGVIVSYKLFLPSVVVFFFVVGTVTSPGKLRILAVTVVISSVVLAVEGMCSYYAGFRRDIFLVYQDVPGNHLLFAQFVRIRGMGFLSDPNDLAQFLLIALPLTSLAWIPRRRVLNVLTVLAPAGALLWAIFLTRSRGALVAMAFMALIALRKKLGNTVSTSLVVLGFAGLLALNFTGGRLISADAGADRLWLWASGLEMFKRAPLFGLGFGKFADIEDLTAHNSLVLCLSEVGLLGATCWLGMLVTTMLDLNSILGGKQGDSSAPSSLESKADRQNLNLSRRVSAESSDAALETGDDAVPQCMPRHWIAAMRLALVSFVATAWFLSRTYEATVYLLLGLATAAIALTRCGNKLTRPGHWFSYTLGVEAAAIAFLYEAVRFRF